MGLEFESPAGHQKSSHPFGWLLFCRWRFEKSSATVRWTVARCGLDRIDTIIFTEGENANESPAESRLRPHTERCGISYCRWRFERIKCNMPGGMLQPPVQTLVATILRVHSRTRKQTNLQRVTSDFSLSLRLKRRNRAKTPLSLRGAKRRGNLLVECRMPENV